MNIREIRNSKHMTQSEVATALGISQVVYCRYETGVRQPSLELLIQLADLFDVTVDELLGRQSVNEQTLSIYEQNLLIASRRADDRAKRDALTLLSTNTTTSDQS